MSRRIGMLLVSLLLPAALATACNIKDDTRHYNQLDSLRVLGVRAEPADLVVGETATLSALVYEPSDREVGYEWSWCPARAGAEEGFACTIGEDQLRQIWNQLDPGLELPPYDLGNGETAEFHHVFGQDVLVGICQAIMGDQGSDPQAVLACLGGLELSVRLRVFTSDDEVVAIKVVPLLLDQGGGLERNTNPDPSGEMEVKRSSDGKLVPPVEALRLNRVYDLKAGFQIDQAEEFLPKNREGGDAGVRRRETLIMTWFVTMGTTRVEGEGGGGPFEGGDRTSFVDGGEFKDLLEKPWELPFEDARDEARVYLVLRDERGGMGWVEHRFAVEAGQ